MDFKAGDIIRARDRLWRVDAIDTGRTILTATNIDSGDLRPQTFFYPLESITEASIPGPSSDVIGDPASNKLLIQAYRYALLHGSAPLLSLQRSCVLPTEYQLVPVIMALNKMDRVRMLIADDVGLGKTIEAGLIVSELMARNVVNRLLVVCPKNLTVQWKEALSYFFQIDAQILSSVSLRLLERTLPPGASPWKHYPHIICSIDYAKQLKVRNAVLEVPWDLVIVDEAHQAAKPHQQSERQSVSMERYAFVHELSKLRTVRHLLLLTATPHNGYTDTYASLLDMLDCGIVSGSPSEPAINRAVAREHVCQRRRKDVEEWFSQHGGEKSPFPSRKQEEVAVNPNAYEKIVIEQLTRYGRDVIELAKQDDRQTVKNTASWVVMHLHKRGLSSPEALRRSLKNRLARVEERIDNNETMAERDLTPEQAKANVLDEDALDDAGDEEVVMRVDQASFGSIESLRTERDELLRLIEAAKTIDPTKDSKLRALTESPKGHLRTMLSGAPGRKKAIIFTRYKDTLDYLEREIPKRMRGFLTSDEIVTVYGDLGESPRNERLAQFQRLGRGLLIATDCISEGINLQHMANQVIHYELPWNPNRLEQRNGRVDRYGQKEAYVHIKTLVTNDTLDAEIFEVLVRKAMRIREDYGFAPPFFGDDSSVFELLSELKGTKIATAQTSLFEYATDAPAPEEGLVLNPFDDTVITTIRNDSFYGQINVDATQIRARLKETEERIGTPEDFQAYVLKGLELFGCTVTPTGDVHGTYRIELSGQLQVTGHTDTIERATFDARTSVENRGIVHLNQGHPVVRRLSELMRMSFFDDKNEGYGRTAVVSTADVDVVTALYFFLVRFSVGTAPSTIIEEILPVACDLVNRTPLGHAAVRRLLSATPAQSSRSIEDFKKHLAMALEEDVYRSAYDEEVARHLASIQEDRRELRTRLCGDSAGAAWLEGIDVVTLASCDLLSVRLYEPVPRGGR